MIATLDKLSTIGGHGTSAAAITTTLHQEIMSGALQPGERLGEVALAERLNVSRGPVREALRRLVDLGLVTFTPNVGARVREFSLADARALYELREALEAEAARLAALRADPGRTVQLQRLLAGHAETVAAHPAGVYLQGGGDADFHTLVARLSGNPLLLRLLSEELNSQLVLLRGQHRNVQGRGRDALVEHERIAEAIVGQDPQLADLLMRRHIRASWQALEGQLALR